MKYKFIWEHPEYSVAKWAKYLQVTRSGYYAWAERREAREREKEAYKKEIKKIFIESEST